MPTRAFMTTACWIAWFAVLAILAALAWTVFPDWVPEVPTFAAFAAVVSAIVLLARAAAKKFLRWLAVAAAVCIGMIGALLLVFQIAIDRVPEQRVQLQDWLNEKTQLSIEFNRLTARWRVYGPELAFVDVTVRTPDRTRVLATARGGSVAFDIWRSLRTGRITAGRFTLESPQLGLIRTRDGRIQIAGQGALSEDTKPFAIENLPVGTFRVRDALLTFLDEAAERDPWSLSGVSFLLAREPAFLELDGRASLPSSLGGDLEFSAQVAGALESPDDAVTTFTLEGEALDLNGWAELFPAGWPTPSSGRGALDLTASFIGQRLQSLQVDAQFNDVTATAAAWSMPLPAAKPLVIGGDVKRIDDDEREQEAQNEEPEPTYTRPDRASSFSYDRAYVRARLVRDGAGWDAQIDEIDLDASDVASNDAQDWQSRGLNLAWSAPSEGIFAASGKADVLLLQSVTPLFAFLPESNAAAHLRALNLQGTVRDLEFSAQKDSQDAPTTYSVSATVDGVGFDPIAKIPGASGISGVVRATAQGGEFRLDTGPLHLHIPWMFRWPLDTNAVRGVITWRQDDAGWHIGADALQFDANDGKGEARLAIRIPHDGSSPYLEVVAQAHDLNPASTPKYLPANLLSEQPLEWLDRAFVSGRVTQGSLELRGPARSFPFRNDDGLFLVQGSVEDLVFDYQAGWMPAMGLTGSVEFRNEGMHASGITANVGQLRVTEASGGIADFKEGDLKISAAASGDLGAALGFLQASPIAKALGEPFAALRGRGDVQATVNLLLPIKHIEDRRIAVTTKLADATVRMTNIDAPITHLNGSLIVRQELPVEADLSGEWLGGPLEVSITPDDRTDENATLMARGRAQAEALAPFVPKAARIEGAFDWRMSTHLSSRPDRGRHRYIIDSTLQGLAIRLPHPAGKDAAELRATHVEVEQGDQQIIARAALGTLRGLLRFQDTNDGWRFDRGGLRADGVLAALPDHPGLRLEGRIDRLRLDDWFALADDERDAPSAEPARTSGGKLSDVLKAANLHVGVLQLYGYEWPDVRGVMQAVDAGWRVDVAGSNAEGQLLIPEDFASSRPLSIDLERLIVMRSPRGSDEQPVSRGEARNPRDWPSLQVRIGDMHIENHPIGGVDLMTTRVGNGMRIDSLRIDQDAVQAEAQGSWLIDEEGERSNLIARITSTDVRATLRALNYTEFLDAERAEVSAELHWPGGFDGNLVKRASGKITVSAEEGQLLMLQPGAGRVLGLFSVAALPRRLALDFSDLTEKGLSFDTIHGDFTLEDGNAFTDNLLLRGPAAEIGVAGRTGLGTQDFDQTAVVTGNLGASIPVAGVIAGGPAVGAALLLFSQVFKEPLKGIARGYYKITGTWDEPVVERVDAAEAKERG